MCIESKRKRLSGYSRGRWLRLFPRFYIGETELYVFPFFLLDAIAICAVFLLKSKKYKSSTFIDIMECLPYICICAAIGGRLLSAITLMISSEQTFFHNVLFGGFVFYGGFIGGAIGLFIYCKCKNVSFVDRADVILSLLPLGQAIGRIGCFLNGCCVMERGAIMGYFQYIIPLMEYIHMYSRPGLWSRLPVFCYLYFLNFLPNRM